MANAFPFLELGFGQDHVWIEEFSKAHVSPMCDHGARVFLYSNDFDIEIMNSLGDFYCPVSVRDPCSRSLEELERYVARLFDEPGPHLTCPFVRRGQSHRPTVYEVETDVVFFRTPVPHSQPIPALHPSSSSPYTPCFQKDVKVFDDTGSLIPYACLAQHFHVRREVTLQVIPYCENTAESRNVRLMLVALWCSPAAFLGDSGLACSATVCSPNPFCIKRVRRIDSLIFLPTVCSLPMDNSYAFYTVGSSPDQVLLKEIEKPSSPPLRVDPGCRSSPPRSLFLAGRINAARNTGINTVPDCFEAQVYFDLELMNSVGIFTCPPPLQDRCAASLDVLKAYVDSLAHDGRSYVHIPFVNKGRSHRPTVYEVETDTIFFREKIPQSVLVPAIEEPRASTLTPVYRKDVKVFDCNHRLVELYRTVNPLASTDIFASFSSLCGVLPELVFSLERL
ncbi:hypothetical protein NMY22_g2387 [Coprinellus aureogranulatus]|nr:hypothetical protein NMY22_g2387 [Coprinellus aureogranulatus]